MACPLTQLFRCYLDCDSWGPGYERVGTDTVKDSYNQKIHLYPEARAVCEVLRDAGVQVAVASRSPVKNWYLEILKLLDLDYMSPVYIGGGSDFGHPGSKVSGHGTRHTPCLLPPVVPPSGPKHGHRKDMVHKLSHQHRAEPHQY